MTVETACRFQHAVLWAANGYDDYGRVKLDARIAVKVRWEIGQEEALDSEGNTIALDSTVIVDRVVPVGSILWLGNLLDLPNPPDDLRQVVDYREIPDVKGRNPRRVVKLMKYSDTLPSLA